MLFKSSIATLVVSAFVGVAANPDKPSMEPGIDRGRFESNLRNNLRPTHSVWDYWGGGWIPRSCGDIARDHGLNPNDFTIFNVHYDDCQEGWTFCRHRNAGASEIDMIDMFGRLPVHMRSFVRYVFCNVVPSTAELILFLVILLPRLISTMELLLLPILQEM